MAFCTITVFYSVTKYGGPMYKEWAEGQIAKMKGVLNAAREDHTSAVKSRIENVKQLGSVINVTKQLFEVSKVWTGGKNAVVVLTGTNIKSGNRYTRRKSVRA